MTPKAKSPAAALPDTVSQFESSLRELEDIVSRLEQGELPLEQSLQLFERGVELTRLCRKSLDGAELKVRNLLESQAPAADDPAAEDAAT
jgi:exodeoxyribonuclease VII small subunit